MQRRITGFERDEVGDWAADLDCLHRQHVRHDPPFRDRPWVLTVEGRAAHLGTDLDCPLCERAELPEGLELQRTLQFDEASLPVGLRRDHKVASGVWALLRVLEGEARFTLAVEPPLDRLLVAGESQPIPPDVLHAVAPAGKVVLTVEFLRRS